MELAAEGLIDLTRECSTDEVLVNKSNDMVAAVSTFKAAEDKVAHGGDKMLCESICSHILPATSKLIVAASTNTLIW